MLRNPDGLPHADMVLDDVFQEVRGAAVFCYDCFKSGFRSWLLECVDELASACERLLDLVFPKFLLVSERLGEEPAGGLSELILKGGYMCSVKEAY